MFGNANVGIHIHDSSEFQYTFPVYDCEVSANARGDAALVSYHFYDVPLIHDRSLWNDLRQKITVLGRSDRKQKYKSVLGVPQFWVEYKMKPQSGGENCVEFGLLASQNQAKLLRRELDFDSNSSLFGASVTLTDSTVQLHMLSWDGDEKHPVCIHSFTI